MKSLWLYGFVDRLGLRNYRAKIMTVAFVGTHVPLIALAAYVALQTTAGWRDFWVVLSVALAATLLGTGVTLLALDHLLRPMMLTGKALRVFRGERKVVALPNRFQDEAGRLMADADETLRHLDRALEALEFSDARTQLPNRKRLVKDLSAALQAGDRLSVCAIRFGMHGRLAETLSLDVAEDAAAEIADRLARAAPAARLYRAGAADFVLLINTLGEGRTLEATLKHAIEASSAPIASASIAVEPSLRAGIAQTPDDGEDADSLIDHAIAASTSAADAMVVRFHSPAALGAARERLHLEQEIRRALTNDEFTLHYQPVVDIAARRVVGAEALIRWAHPQHGLIAPGKFIPIAEESGQIDEIGIWALRRACAQIRNWRGGAIGAMKVAVNLSARQFLDPNLIGHIRNAVDEAKVPADLLEIELTETAATVDYDYTRQAFGKLRDFGVGIAIDDFGAGFASLSCLRKLPFDKLKIDREFVTDVHARRESQAICRALIGLGEGLGLKVLAEGTESAEEVAYLQSLGCEMYQGYYFARPIAGEDFTGAAQKAELSAAAFAMRQLEPRIARAG